MNFVDEFVEVVLVTGTEVNEGLNRLVRVRGDILSLASFDDLDCVVYE